MPGPKEVFIKYEKEYKAVIDNKTGQSKMVEAGYRPKLREGGLTEEILLNGNPEKLQSFWDENADHLNAEEKAYLQNRLHTARKVQKIGAETRAKLSNGESMQGKEPKKEGGFIGFADLKYPEKQTSSNGCWSCSYSLLLKSRGVDLDQREIRGWRPDYTKDSSTPREIADGQQSRREVSRRLNVDTSNSIMDNGDLMNQVLPNAGLQQVSLKPLSTTVMGIDGRMATKDELETIRKFYKEQMKKQLTDTIRHAIQVDHSPVSLTVDGHYITITGISEDGKNLRYEDSLENGTQTMKTDRLVNMATEPHTNWFGNYVVPGMYGGIDMTWIRDIPVPEHEKRNEEKPVIHPEEPGLVQIDENGKVTVNVPLKHPSATSLGNPSSGQVEGKGVSDQIMLDTKALSKLLGGKKVTGFGPNNGYTMGNKEAYYPKQIYYKKDPQLAKYRNMGENVQKPNEPEKKENAKKEEPKQQWVPQRTSEVSINGGGEAKNEVKNEVKNEDKPAKSRKTSIDELVKESKAEQPKKHAWKLEMSHTDSITISSSADKKQDKKNEVLNNNKAMVPKSKK